MKRYFTEQEGLLTLPDGTALYHKSYLPPDPDPRLSLLFCHGYGDHLHRYGNLVRAFDQSGLSLHAMDMRGHGRSGGKRGAAPDFSTLIEDLSHFIDHLQTKNLAHTPLLFGHSLGGLLVISFTLTGENYKKIRSLAANGPALGVRMDLTMRLQRIIGNILRHIAPDLRLPVQLDITNLSHDPEVVRLYKEDPLVHGMISSRLGMEIIEYGKRALQKAPEFPEELNLFLSQGGEDRIVSPEATRTFFERAGSRHRQYKFYPELYHETFNEPPLMRERFLSDFREWALSQFSS